MIRFFVGVANTVLFEQGTVVKIVALVANGLSSVVVQDIEALRMALRCRFLALNHFALAVGGMAVERTGGIETTLVLASAEEEQTKVTGPCRIVVVTEE